MAAAALEALQVIFSFSTLPFLLFGVCLGLLIGLLPGLGGIAGMAVLLPFVLGMEPAPGIAMLVGMMAITTTSDTFVSVLLGVPGSNSSQATILDGYALAKRGEAGRALGAAFFVSAVGGVFGAFVLILIIPVARPLIMALGSPELFMLVLLGVALVATLVSGSAVAGLTAGLFGLLLSTVGPAPSTAELRFVVGTGYLAPGISLVVLALGLFALPEMIDLIKSGKPIAGDMQSLENGTVGDGIRDALKNKKLILTSSAVGVGVGITPGLGGSVVDWIAYGLAARFCKDTEGFGKGDIRGVIAPESANNAKESGSLIPTLLFGIPGSGSTALLLGAMVMIGVTPGPTLLRNENISIVFVVAWSLVVANVIATSLSLLLAKKLIRISLISPRVLVPFLAVVVTLAAYQSSRQWGDVLGLAAFGTLGWLMKQAGWPRPPLLVGFVLGTAAERYLGISYGRFGLTWLTNPVVVGVAIFIVLIVASGFAKTGKKVAAIRALEPLGEGADDEPVGMTSKDVSDE